MRLPASLELVRPHNCLLAGSAVLMGFIIAARSCSVPLTQAPLAAALAFAVAAIVCAGGNAVNDYCDREIDAINRPERPIPSGRLTPQRALGMARYLFIIGVILAIPLGAPCILLAALNSLVLVLYAAELKRRGLVGNLTIGYLVGSTFLFGGLAAGELKGMGAASLVAGELRAVSVLAAMAALSTVGRELIKDIEDMKGDRELGLRTFPIDRGAKSAAALAIAFIATALALSPLPYALGLFGPRYLAFVSASALAFALAALMIARDQRRRSAARASTTCKIAMGIGLLAFLAGAI
ncbi:MAG: UbiA family prenyltransferase [Hadesarchaea archaeon]|nr:UbiA family prenyltransferase [Hadesarchaea archaeon]